MLVATRRFINSEYVTEGYYCDTHAEFISRMIVQKATLRDVVARSEEIIYRDDHATSITVIRTI